MGNKPSQLSTNKLSTTLNLKKLIKIGWKSKNECNGSITSIEQCPCLLRICEMLTKFNDLTITNININILMLLNDFNHLLSNHIKNGDFEYISKYFGKCDVLKCTIMARYHRNRELYTICSDNPMNKKKMLYTQIIDKIHCHFMHCYDIGCRLTSMQLEQIQSECKLNDDKKMDFAKNNLLRATTKVLKSKQKVFKQFVDIDSFKKFKQLNSNNLTNNNKEYSFGQFFYYWPKYKDLTDLDSVTINKGYRYCDWYINQKYMSLKEELINNNIETINNGQWKHEYDKATLYMQTDYCKTLVADPSAWSSPCKDTRMYDIPKGDLIKIQHLIAIIMYCGYTTLSYKFSETFRRIKSQKPNNDQQITNQQTNVSQTGSAGWKKKVPNMESDDSLKNRNANFFHFSKCIVESINLFSSKAADKPVVTFYHGIQEQITFHSMCFSMNQPFSTTSSQEVALHFCTKSGMLLEFNLSPNNRYFSCGWISDFSYENELLFVQCRTRIRFTNITNVAIGYDFNLFIKAISIIDSCTSLTYFYSDIHVWKRLYNAAKKSNKLKFNNNPRLYGAKEIDSSLKLLTIILIRHELNRYKPNDYDKYNDIDPFIENILHNICIKKELIIIDWELMNTEVINSGYKSGGYQGYLFLKYLFCANDYQMINLDFILLLFPNATAIGLTGLSYISSKCLDNVLKFLSTNNHQKCSGIFFSLARSINMDATTIYNASIKPLIILYQHKLINIGWNITFDLEMKQLIVKKTKLHRSLNN